MFKLTANKIKNKLGVYSALLRAFILGKSFCFVHNLQ